MKIVLMGVEKVSNEDEAREVTWRYLKRGYAVRLIDIPGTVLIVKLYRVRKDPFWKPEVLTPTPTPRKA